MSAAAGLAGLVCLRSNGSGVMACRPHRRGLWMDRWVYGVKTAETLIWDLRGSVWLLELCGGEQGCRKQVVHATPGGRGFLTYLSAHFGSTGFHPQPK